MKPLRRLALCGDDYGLAPAIDRALAELLARGRLSRISCIVNQPRWPDAARALTRGARARAGLHLNLTEGRPLTGELAAVWTELPTLQRLIVDAHLGRLPLAALRAELRAQFEACAQALGQLPAHLDGHQHVHHLPQIRELVLELAASHKGLRVRHTGRVRGPGYAVKRLLIEGTGGSALGRRLDALGLAANGTLCGVYDFVATDYRRLMRGWLAALPERGALLFCHPGEAGAGDAIAAARTRELAYLGGSAFGDDLAEAGVLVD
ncbi:MAG: ChbG/HpnK family deacetylase [Burkholderiales bacterium]|nr:ChbG/HpnK family deacetylase [Burkholderiales bacterium]MDE1926185.1 ChbG/HpnK family deacetylase [Burkholderiales bacterium]MDE2157598.1 ChbG/HpnK family deacetylase [Burkholderiales bacterium]MDE2503372.1 ChbG/HpnK family deacetylase [Burkholderiales bacterium]